MKKTIIWVKENPATTTLIVIGVVVSVAIITALAIVEPIMLTVPGSVALAALAIWLVEKAEKESIRRTNKTRG